MKISPEILQMTPYVPGKPISETQREFGLSRVVKVASNENPLGVSPKALAAVRAALDQQFLYPDPAAYELTSVLTRLWKVPKENISYGNGSDEIIDLLTRIFCEPGDGVLTSETAFHAYEVSSFANRLKLYRTPVGSDLKFDLNAMADLFLAHPEYKIRLIFIANPNNPTGTYCNRAELESFLKKVGNRDDVLIVFDDAYTEFVRAKDYAPSQEFFGKVSNVLTMRTFSKAYGLAGFRVGALLAPADIINVYNRVRKPFNVNGLAQVAAAAAVEDYDFIKRTQELTWTGLDDLQKWLGEQKLPYWPSQGNFVLFDTLRDSMQVNQACLRKGLILRPLLNYHMKTQLRWSVGTPEENAFAKQVLSEVLPTIPKVKDA